LASATTLDTTAGRLSVATAPVAQRPARVLFVADHVGYAGNVIHGATTYFLATLASFPPERVQAELCVLGPRHAAAERFAEAAVPTVFFGRQRWDPRTILDIVGKARTGRFDLLHLNGQKAGLAGALAARLTGLPAVMHLHDAHRLPRPLKPLQRAMAGWLDGAVVPSAAIRRIAEEEYGLPAQRIQVVPNGIRLTGWGGLDEARVTVRRELGLDAAALVFAVVGRLDSQKGQGHLLRAFQPLHARYPEARLLVVGDGDTRAELEALSRRSGIADAVRFTGYRRDIPAVLAAADVVVVPSLGAEAFGYTALEALASARPVVAYRSGGLGEIVEDGHTGLLVPPGDEAALTAALARFADDPALGARLGAAGPAAARALSIEHHVERLVGFYEGVLARHHRDEVTVAL